MCWLMHYMQRAVAVLYIGLKITYNERSGTQQTAGRSLATLPFAAWLIIWG
jgi:hypothetical protein